MPISGNSYYDENQASGTKKKPFFKAYLDALKAGKQALDAAGSQESPQTIAPAPVASMSVEAPAYPAQTTLAAPAAVQPPVAAPIAPAAIQSSPVRRAAKRRRALGDITEAAAPTASMDAMMQHILELAQKVEAAASKVEAVADKAEASARPSAEDGVMVPARTTFSRPAPHHSGSHSGEADPIEIPAVPTVISDSGFPSAATPTGGWRGLASESSDRDTAASGLVTLEHEMSIPKVAPFILNKGSDTPVSPTVLELRPPPTAAPDLLLTKTQDEPRAQGAPIVLRPQAPKDKRAANNGR